MGSEHNPIDSPGSILGDARRCDAEIDGLRARKLSLLEKLAVFVSASRPLHVIVGRSRLIRVSVGMEGLELEELGPVIHAADLYWPEGYFDEPNNDQRNARSFPAPGAQEEAEFGPKDGIYPSVQATDDRPWIFRNNFVSEPDPKFPLKPGGP